MLIQARRQRGFSLVEMMVVIALLGILFAAAIPAVGAWSADSKLRSAAESFTNGVRLAQATAVGRNRITVMALTSGTPAYTSTPAADSANWMVLVDPLSTETLDSSYLIQTSTQARQNGVAVTGPALVCFNSFGQMTTTLTTALGTATCKSAGGNDAANATSTQGTTGAVVSYQLTRTGSKRKYRVLVYGGGRVRMCDALKTLSTTDPDGCP